MNPNAPWNSLTVDLSYTWIITVSTQQENINIFTSNESMLDFYIYEATFIFLVIFIIILYRIFKY